MGPGLGIRSEGVGDEVLVDGLGGGVVGYEGGEVVEAFYGQEGEGRGDLRRGKRGRK